MNLKPLDDRVVVKPSEAEQTTSSGLVIPDTAKEKPQQGEVLAVGPGRWSDSEGKYFPLEINVGDTVLYSKYGGTEVNHKGDDILILTSRDVLAIVTLKSQSKVVDDKGDIANVATISAADAAIGKGIADAIDTK
jgi:chaperonin GroES